MIQPRSLDSRVRMAMRGSRAHLERPLTEEDLDALYGFIEAEIVGAMDDARREEREACAKIADNLAKRTRGEWEENPLLSLRGTENCEAIRDVIRARSESEHS